MISQVHLFATKDNIFVLLRKSGDKRQYHNNVSKNWRMHAYRIFLNRSRGFYLFFKENFWGFYSGAASIQENAVCMHPPIFGNVISSGGTQKASNVMLNLDLVTRKDTFQYCLCYIIKVPWPPHHLNFI